MPGQESFWAYGGDFGPPGVPSDDNFCHNGIVQADRSPTPQVPEFKKAYQYIQVQAQALNEAGGSFTFKNWFDFMNPKQVFEGSFTLTADAKVIARGALPPLDLGYRDSRTIPLSWKAIVPEPGVEYFVNFSFKLANDTPWARAGFPLAWEQFKLPVQAPRRETAMKGTVTTRSDDAAVYVDGKDFSLTFRKNDAALHSFVFAGLELMKAPLLPHFWRAPTDNDRGFDMATALGVWSGNTMKAHSVAAERVHHGAVRVVTQATLKEVPARLVIRYDVYPSADVHVKFTMEPLPQAVPVAVPMMPRVGMQMALAPGFDLLRWFGRGPHETYSDRKDAPVGMYSGSVASQYFNYAEPGETGNKTDVRWAALIHDKGVGLLAAATTSLLNVNALPFTTADLQSVKHGWELPRRNFTTLNIDHRQMGLGGENSWGARPLPPHVLPFDRYEYSFRLRPFHTKSDDPLQLSREALPVVAPL